MSGEAEAAGEESGTTLEKEKDGKPYVYSSFLHTRQMLFILARQ